MSVFSLIKSIHDINIATMIRFNFHGLNPIENNGFNMGCESYHTVNERIVRIIQSILTL